MKQLHYFKDHGAPIPVLGFLYASSLVGLLVFWLSFIFVWVAGYYAYAVMRAEGIVVGAVIFGFILLWGVLVRIMLCKECAARALAAPMVSNKPRKKLLWVVVIIGLLAGILRAVLGDSTLGITTGLVSFLASLFVVFSVFFSKKFE